MSKSTRRGHLRLAKIFVCLGAAAVWASTYVTVESASSLTSHWMLNEANGTSTFDSLASRSGTLRNGVVWTTGRMGAAVSMDGVDDYISLPSLEVTGYAISLTAWVKNSSFPTNVAQRFIAKASDATEAGSYWVLGQTSTSGQNRLFFRLKSGNVTRTLTASTGNLPLNAWYHVAATYDGAQNASVSEWCRSRLPRRRPARCLAAPAFHFTSAVARKARTICVAPSMTYASTDQGCRNMKFRE